jgi:hypothetical protein
MTNLIDSEFKNLTDTRSVEDPRIWIEQQEVKRAKASFSATSSSNDVRSLEFCDIPVTKNMTTDSPFYFYAQIRRPPSESFQKAEQLDVSIRPGWQDDKNKSAPWPGTRQQNPPAGQGVPLHARHMSGKITRRVYDFDEAVAVSTRQAPTTTVEGSNPSHRTGSSGSSQILRQVSLAISDRTPSAKDESAHSFESFRVRIRDQLKFCDMRRNDSSSSVNLQRK